MAADSSVLCARRALGQANCSSITPPSPAVSQGVFNVFSNAGLRPVACRLRCARPAEGGNAHSLGLRLGSVACMSEKPEDERQSRFT